MKTKSKEVEGMVVEKITCMVVNVYKVKTSINLSGS